MKKILFITGTRADFGKIKRLMRYVDGRPDMELHVLVTGMHMMKLYGATHLEVRRENFKNIYLVANQYSGEPMCSILGTTISVIARIADDVEPDMLVVHGDRLEALAGATVGALSNTLVCHIEGGELSGTIDDLIRHSVSKLAHIHMVANQEARQRLIQMGEDERNIYIIGSPDLDVMSAADLPDIEAVKQHYGIRFGEYAVSLFHPVTTEEDRALDHALSYFQALKESGQDYVVIYPNNDTGSRSILDALVMHEGYEKFATFPSVRFEYFLTLLKHASFIIGNSSAGVREAPFYGVPSVNVGTRQSRRFFGPSVTNCGYGAAEILAAIATARHKGRSPPSAWFGDGDSVSKFASALECEHFWRTPVQKPFVDARLR